MPFDEGNPSVNGDASYFGPDVEYDEGLESDDKEGVKDEED